MVLITRLCGGSMVYGGCGDCAMWCVVKGGRVNGVWCGHGYYMVCMWVVCMYYVVRICVVYRWYMVW